MIAEVNVSSLEQTANTERDNAELQRFVHSELATELARGGFEVLGPEDPGTAPGTLVLRVALHVKYGNRALRYFVGFGAGSGYIEGSMIGTDARTGAQVLSVNSTFELAGGIYGGSSKKAAINSARLLLHKSGLRTARGATPPS